MSTSNLAISEEERTFLQRTLESLLLGKHRELMHTSTSEFREFVQHERDLLQGLLNRLRNGAK